MIRRRLKHGHLKKNKPAQLKITSMMDILTVLLLFLLKSFVVEGEMVTPPPDVELPTSSSEELPEESLVIAISPVNISLGDEPVATVKEALAGDDLLIAPLGARLDAALTRMEKIARAKGDEDEVSGKITIQGDSDMEFQLLQRIMYTCTFSGFSEMNLAVVQGG